MKILIEMFGYQKNLYIFVPCLILKIINYEKTFQNKGTKKRQIRNFGGKERTDLECNFSGSFRFYRNNIFRQYYFVDGGDYLQ
jgi:hypothetical protein